MPETIPTPTASEAQRPIFTIPLSLNINASTVPHKDDEKTQRYRSKMVSGVREDMLCRSTVSVQDLLKKIFAISDDDIKAHGDVDLGVVPADVVKIFVSISQYHRSSDSSFPVFYTRYKANGAGLICTLHVALREDVGESTLLS